MANVKISELPVATSVTGPDSFPVVQGGVTKQASRSVLFASPTFTGTTTTDILTATGNVTFDGGAFVFNESGADKDARFEGDGDPNLLFLDASTDRVGIGTNSPAENLTVGDTNDRVGLYKSGTTTQLRLGSTVAGTAMMVLQYNRSTGAYQISEGTNGNLSDPDISISASGDFIHRVNSTAPTLSTNSTMSFELTSNTSLKIVVRGTDGTTRSVSLTLS